MLPLLIILRIIYYNFQVFGYLVLKVFTGFYVKDRPQKPKVLTDGFKDGFAIVNGIKLHYVQKGNPADPLMLFLHGFPEFWYSWRYQMQEFSQKYWCVALDQRGYNESDKPHDIDQYQLKLLISDIHGLIEHLGNKKCILVCHDWGAIVGFEYAMLHCDTVEKYILMAAPPRDIHRELCQTNEEQSRMSWYFYFLQTPVIPEMVMRAFDMKLLEEMCLNNDSAIEVYKYVFGKPGAFTPPINYYRSNVFSTIAKTPILDTSVAPPGLLLLAENDKYISKDCGPVAEKRIPNLKFVVLESTDHFCQQNNPTRVNYEMLKFLGTTKP